MQLSYDIWEECENIHAYSIASIFAALNKMLKIYEMLFFMGQVSYNKHYYRMESEAWQRENFWQIMQ